VGGAANDNDDLSNIDVSLENCAPARLILCKQSNGLYPLQLLHSQPLES